MRKACLYARLASGRSDGSSGLLKSSADSVLTGTSPPNGDSPLASFGTLNVRMDCYGPREAQYTEAQPTSSSTLPIGPHSPAARS